MTDFIQAVFITALFIWGVYCLFSDGHIFSKFGDWAYNHWPDWIYKPIIGCSACMASVWGTLAYFTAFYQGILLWVPFCICICGLNFIIIRLYDTIKDIGQ